MRQTPTTHAGRRFIDTVLHGSVVRLATYHFTGAENAALPPNQLTTPTEIIPSPALPTLGE
jgi:hypothetical protein